MRHKSEDCSILGEHRRLSFPSCSSQDPQSQLKSLLLQEPLFNTQKTKTKTKTSPATPITSLPLWNQVWVGLIGSTRSLLFLGSLSYRTSLTTPATFPHVIDNSCFRNASDLGSLVHAHPLLDQAKRPVQPLLGVAQALP